MKRFELLFPRSISCLYTGVTIEICYNSPRISKHAFLSLIRSTASEGLSILMFKAKT